MVKIMNKVYSLLAFILVTNAAYAQDNSFLPEAKLKQGDAQTLNLGVGFTQKMIHLNTEWVNPYGIAYVKGGVYLNDDHTAGGQVGFRYPVQFTGKDKNGYYLGVYAGHIDSKKVDNSYESRLGGGVDLAYVMMSRERISTFSVGIGAGEKLTNNDGTVSAETKPQLQFSYTISIGL